MWAHLKWNTLEEETFPLPKEHFCGLIQAKLRMHILPLKWINASVLLTFWWRLMSHFSHRMSLWLYYIVVNLVSFMKTAMQSRDNSMTVAFKHFSHNKINELKEKEPIAAKQGSRDLKSMFYCQISLNNNSYLWVVCFLLWIEE